MCRNAPFSAVVFAGLLPAQTGLAQTRVIPAASWRPALGNHFNALKSFWGKIDSLVVKVGAFNYSRAKLPRVLK